MSTPSMINNQLLTLLQQLIGNLGFSLVVLTLNGETLASPLLMVLLSRHLLMTTFL